MSKRLLLIVSGLGIFLLFVFYSYLVHKDIFTAFDFNTTVRLQDNISKRWDKLFSFFSDIGKFEIMLIVLISIFVVTRKFLAGFIALVLFAGFHVFELFGKFFVDHPPPPQFMLRTEQILNFPQFHVRSESSYPSGHSGRAFFITVVLAVLIWQSKKLSLPVKIVLLGLLAVYDLIMVVSRVTLGEHWSTDVIGGLLLGIALGLITGGFLVGKERISKYKIEIKKVE